jgi:lipopolysaccharide export system protein LptA
MTKHHENDPQMNQMTGRDNMEPIAGSPRQVVFIDSAADLGILAAGAAADMRVIILDRRSDGVRQIAGALVGSGALDVACIDIVAHGQDGRISLGDAVLCIETIALYRDALAKIGAALRPGGAIRLYACDVGRSAVGTAFLEHFSAATGGAPIAAASHRVGAAAAGGSWTLDVNNGAIDAPLPFTAAALGAYPGVLAQGPTITAGGAVDYVSGVTNDVTLDTGLMLSDPSDNTLTSATVQILAGGVLGDTLTATNLEGLSYSFYGNGGESGTITLVLSGTASLATYQTVLQSVVYSFNGTDPTDDGTARQRTINWLITDSNGLSTPYSASSTLDVFTPPTITAGATASDVIGESPVTLDTGIVVSAPETGGILQSATVSVAGGIAADGDTLAANTTGTGITASYDAATETLTLTGTDTAANYQAVLQSVTDSSTAVGDRTIDWSVNDGKYTGDATSSLTVLAMPSIAAGATQFYEAGVTTSAVLDRGLTIADADPAPIMTSATVTIGGFLPGDTLTVGDPFTLATIDFSDGTLTISGDATLGAYQAALDSVAYSFTGTDPTDDGTDLSRTITWTVTDSNAVTSAGATSTLNVNTPPTITAGASADYVLGGTPAILDSGITITAPESGGTLASAVVGVATGGFSLGDTLAATTTGTAITASYNATTETLSLTGTDSIAHYEAVLDSVTFAATVAASGSRQIDWGVNDGTLSGKGVTSTVNVLCFCAGTLIATPRGEVPVERLAQGDSVLTASGAVRPIVWIGVGRQLATRGRRGLATPVIVAKGALAPNVPHRDLRVTKAHALFVDGALIPVEFLVNHRTIRWDDHAQEVVLYHIELASHDILLANGAPAESYRDDGNRWLFQNANSGWGLPPQEPCAPVLTGGPVVDAAWLRLLERAGPRRLAPQTDQADLHVLTDGSRLDAATRVGDAYVFHLPAVPRDLRIVSRAAAPAELGLARDPRVLGVALRRLVVREGSRYQVIDATDERLLDGFHAFEADGGYRWTDGNAAIAAELYAGFQAPMELVLYVGATTRYLADGVARQAA